MKWGSVVVLCFVFLLVSVNFVSAVIEFEENFLTDPGAVGSNWTVKIKHDAGVGIWESGEYTLIDNVGHQGIGMIANFDLNSITSKKWTAEFDFKSWGNGDGFVFMFYKDSSYLLDNTTIASGKGEGFMFGADTGSFTEVPGYGIEFALYPPVLPNLQNSGYVGEVNFIKDNSYLPEQGLASSGHEPRVNENVWHTATVDFDNGYVTVDIDNDEVLNYTISNMDYTYSGVGFSAGTGVYDGTFKIKDFKLSSVCVPIDCTDRGCGGDGCGGSCGDCVAPNLSCSSAYQCVECVVDDNCYDPNFPRCDTSSNTCVECRLGEGDCEDGESCSSSGSCVSDDVPLNTWGDMNGNRISAADEGDYVRFLSNVIGPYDIFWRVNADTDTDTDSVVEKYWKINVPFNNPDELGFSFSSSSGSSDVWLIEGNGVEDEFSLDILDPLCGEYFNVGTVKDISINASDLDDLILGNLTINGVPKAGFNNTNGNIIDISHEFLVAGNIQIVAFATNSDGENQKVIANVMVYDSSDPSDQFYVSSCIDSPRNFDRFTSSSVGFVATSSLGLKYEGEVTVIPKEALQFDWRFKLSSGEFGEGCSALGTGHCPGGQPVWDFTRTFPTVNNNEVYLSVSIPESLMS
jgi:hypothetical protein